jgi:predicted ATP-dependent serine protease
VVSSKELNGLQGIVAGCACDELHGINSTPRNTIMSSTDIVNLEFEKLGFQGKWLNLIGDPSSGFTAMIFGKPKMGKSYLAVDFAGYLARNHGTVLYVAREEGIDDTLQQKLKDKNVAHPDLYVGDFLPEDLGAYDFVFLDSVNKLRLSPEELDAFKKEYPETSFIYIFQTTKLGNFRGGNEFQHDVDVVIEVAEKGKAIQFGRFNQGGAIDIFGR